MLLNMTIREVTLGYWSTKGLGSVSRMLILYAGVKLIAKIYKLLPKEEKGIITFDGSSWHEKDKVLPCCDSYFITKNCATQMSNNFIPIRYPNNIQLSYILDKLKIKFGRTFPNIVADGSKLGFFTSSISPNNILLFNNTYKFIYKMLNKPDLTIEEGEHIKSLFENNTFKESPDFMFLEGLFYMRIQEYSKSKEFFDKAIVKYEEQCSPLNNSSAIIQNYVELARHIQ